MARMKNVDGVNIPFTAEEETARDAEEAAWTAGETARNAQAEINRLEGTVTPRIGALIFLSENLETIAPTHLYIFHRGIQNTLEYRACNQHNSQNQNYLRKQKALHRNGPGLYQSIYGSGSSGNRFSYHL